MIVLHAKSKFHYIVFQMICACFFHMSQEVENHKYFVATGISSKVHIAENVPY